MSERSESGGSLQGARLEVGILGDLEVRADGRPLALGPRLQRALLTLLVIDVGRVLSVDRLIDLLWGDEPPPAATASLQAYVSQLRRLLEPDRVPRAPATVLRTREPGYVLELDEQAVDATRFRRLADAGRKALGEGDTHRALGLLEEALELWRGAPLGEFGSEPWARPVVSQLVEEHETVLEDRVDAWLAQGRHGEVIGALEAMVAEHPYRERRWAQLMVSLYRSGRQADALRAYTRCRQQLADDLGITPGAELDRLEQAILNHDSALEPSGGPRSWSASSARGPAPGTRIADAEAPLEAPGLVEREVHLRRIAERLAELPGRGGAIVFVGEPGAGKTVLAEAAVDLGRAAGATVAWARCVDAEGAPALWPWVELLRSLPQGPAVEAALTRLRGEAVEAPGSAEAFGIYEAVLEALRELTAAGPLVAVIDDLHSADASSLKLLETISGDLNRLGVLLVLTMRDTEPAAHLGGALGELVRHRGVEQLLVPGLGKEGVGRLARQFVGEDVADDFASALYERTSGNPFCVGELLRLLRSERPTSRLGASDVMSLDVPSGVRDVIERRVSRLPSDTRSVLAVAAAVGRMLDLELLERIAGVDTEQLMLALEPAVAAGVLIERDVPWGYEFRHALIQESLYAGLGSLDRARLHARIATAIEELGDTSSDETVTALAHHHLRAGPFGDSSKAVRFSRASASAALRQGAWADAVGHLRLALEALGQEAKAGVVRCDVLVELGTALRADGDIEPARAALHEAIDIADRLGDEDRVLTAAVAFASVSLWGARPWGDPDLQLVDLLERLLRRPDLDDARRARLLATLSLELYNSGHREEDRWHDAQEALDIGRRLGDSEIFGIGVVATFAAAQGPDHQAESEALIDEVIAGSDPPVAPAVQAVARTNRLLVLIRRGEIAAFDAEFSRVRELALELRLAELQAQLFVSEAARELLLGRIAEGLDVFERGYAMLTGLSDNWRQPSYFVCQIVVYLVCGQLGAHVDELLAQVDHPAHPSLPHLAAPASALALVQRGEIEKARDLAKRTFTEPARVWTWMLETALWAQVSASTGWPDPQMLYDELLPFSGQLAVAGAGIDCGGAVDSLLAPLAECLGRHEDALAHARSGLELERRAGTRAWLGRSERLVAELEAGAGNVQGL